MEQSDREIYESFLLWLSWVYCLPKNQWEEEIKIKIEQIEHLMGIRGREDE